MHIAQGIVKVLAHWRLVQNSMLHSGVAQGMASHSSLSPAKIRVCDSALNKLAAPAYLVTHLELFFAKAPRAFSISLAYACAPLGLG